MYHIRLITVSSDNQKTQRRRKHRHRMIQYPAVFRRNEEPPVIAANHQRGPGVGECGLKCRPISFERRRQRIANYCFGTADGRMRLRINQNPGSAGAGGQSQWPTTGAKQADGKQTQKMVNLFHKAMPSNDSTVSHTCRKIKSTIPQFPPSSKRGHLTLCTRPVCRGLARNIGHELSAKGASRLVELMACKQSPSAM